MPTISDINSRTRYLCDADTTSYIAADLLRETNAGYEELIGKLITLDGSWQLDDSNYTDLPIATTTLVAGQQDYSFASDVLAVERVEVLDQNGLWRPLTPIDKSQISEALSEYQSVDGLPTEYDKQGSSLFLYPAPAAANVTLTNGLKVYFQRTASVFTSAEVTTGTKQPGFASPWHYILSYKAAVPYCMKYHADRVALYVAEAARMEKDLIAFYARREKDVRKRMTSAPIRHR